jgi:hypothetical protein
LVTGSKGFWLPETLLTDITDKNIPITQLIKKSSLVEIFFLDMRVIIVSATNLTVKHRGHRFGVEAVEFLVKF